MVLGLCKIAFRNINSTILISHSKSSQYLNLNKSGYKKIRGKACNSSTSYLYYIIYNNVLELVVQTELHVSAVEVETEGLNLGIAVANLLIAEETNLSYESDVV